MASALLRACSRALRVDDGIRLLVAVEQFGPDIIHIGADHIDELAGFIFGRADFAGLLLAGRHAAAGFKQGLGINAEEIGHNQRDQDKADTAPGELAATHAAPVLDVSASASTFPAHVPLRSCQLMQVNSEIQGGARPVTHETHLVIARPGGGR